MSKSGIRFRICHEKVLTWKRYRYQVLSRALFLRKMLNRRNSKMLRWRNQIAGSSDKSWWNGRRINSGVVLVDVGNDLRRCFLLGNGWGPIIWGYWGFRKGRIVRLRRILGRRWKRSWRRGVIILGRITSGSHERSGFASKIRVSSSDGRSLIRNRGARSNSLIVPSNAQ